MGLTNALSNAKQVALAMKIYAIDYEGQYPERLEELYEGGYLSEENQRHFLGVSKEGKKFGQLGPIEYLTPGALKEELAPEVVILRIPWEGEKWIQVTADYAGSIVDHE